MPYKTVQNSTWLDDRIKKSTFLPYPIRVLASVAIKRVFKCRDPLINYPIMLYLFFPFFGFGFCTFAHFSQIFFFLVWHLLWCVNRDRTKYNINKEAMWWCSRTPPHSHLLFLQVLVILYFSWFLVRLSCCCLEAFLSSDFFNLHILRKLWMSSFYRLWLRLIQSYGHQDVAFGWDMTL